MNIPPDLPQKRLRSARGADHPCHISVLIEVVTPILGGGSRARQLDSVDVIRAPTIRGHLRFWWRALYGHHYRTPLELYVAESAIWGRAADAEGHGRSTVEVRIDVQRRAADDPATIDPQRTPGAYALWPARNPPAPRRHPGTKFELRMACSRAHQAEVCDAVRAWLLFGGYGSRTRRGLGSLSVVEDAPSWLPAAMTRDALRTLFARDVLAPSQRTVVDIPWLAGADLHVGRPTNDAVKSWITALDWLKEFRQGTQGGEGHRAREPGVGGRPGRSNWPESDKIRRLTNRTRGHAPRHNATPAWPRASFGLPIVGRFQKQGRDGGRLDEPDDFELRWRLDGEERDRLASPLIVKAVPLADGSFVPCALWLHRAPPAGSRVEVYAKGVAGSGAPFDRLVAPEDTPRFAALAGKSSLRRAFLDWLREAHQTKVVAP